MVGYKTYLRMQDLESDCHKLGFTLDGRGEHVSRLSKFGFPTNEDVFFIRVAEDDGTRLPIYSRGVEMFAGDLSSCECFIKGWQKHQEYTTMLGFKTKIANAEKKTADHYQGERLKHAMLNGRDPGYNGVLPDNEHNSPF